MSDIYTEEYLLIAFVFVDIEFDVTCGPRARVPNKRVESSFAFEAATIFGSITYSVGSINPACLVQPLNEVVQWGRISPGTPP